MKICCTCKEPKALSEFYRDRNKSDGFDGRCKSCQIKCVRKYQSTDKGKLVAKRADKARTGTSIRKASHNKASRKYKKTSGGRTQQHLSCIRRRERKANLDTALTADQIRDIYDKFNHECFKCHSTENLSIDHHIPLFHGHGLSISNAVILCVSCNSSKGTKSPAEFYTPNQLLALEHLGVAN